MANDFSNNPYVLDTAGATDLLVPVAGARLQIAAVRWTGGTTAADTMLLTNSAGKTIAEVILQASTLGDAEIDFFPPLSSIGLKLATLTRGKVYIYLVLGG